jgi:GTPase SAR1 family protein
MYNKKIYRRSLWSKLSFNSWNKLFKKIIIDVWDIAGQEKYYSLGSSFYKDSYIVCLVYNITNL